MNQALKEYIESVFEKQDICFQEPMSRHTSFRTGGEADCLLQIRSVEQLQRILSYLRKTGNEYFLLGNGTNLLVSDRGYQGVVLQIGGGLSGISIEGEKIRVQAGALLSKTAKAAMDAGLAGMEFASGIPGSVGGGIVMNAGAYDGEMKQIVEQVTVLNEDGELMELDCDTMEFGYRTSVIRNRPFVVVEALLSLQKGDPEQILAKMADFAQRRRAKQPLEYPSAGSVFKRYPGRYTAQMIDEAGLRGLSVGGAQVSEKHAGFIVNKGNATSSDVIALVGKVREAIRDKYGIEIECEIIHAK